MASRIRPTLRCVVEDLGLPIPELDVDIGSLDDPLVREAQRIAPDSPKGQKRILVIKSPLIFRIRHGNRRGATWVNGDDVLWLLAVEERREGSDDDAYQYFAALHRRGRLLPTEDDALRLRSEGAAQWLLSIRSEIITLCTEATFSLESNLPFEQVRTLSSGITVRLRAVPGDLQEIWFAISVRDADGIYYRKEWRDLMFAVVEQELNPDEWEWVTEFAGKPLPEHEIGRLYLLA